MNDTAMPQIPPDYVHWFRNSAPYINTHRGKTFVIMFDGEAVQHENFQHIIHDIALLHSLGIRLILVHGARAQINQNLKHWIPAFLFIWLNSELGSFALKRCS